MWHTDRSSGWPPDPLVQNLIKDSVRRLIFAQELGVPEFPNTTLLLPKEWSFPSKI